MAEAIRVVVAGTPNGTISYSAARPPGEGGRAVPHAAPPMFEKLRQSLDDLLARATKPEDRRAVLGQMKDALVHARVGLDGLRDAVRQTQRRLEAERRELETMTRRKGLAQGINDAETVAIAERFERQHAEKIGVLEAKLQAQQAELALVEREVEEMGAELKRAMAGIPNTAAGGTPAGGSRVGGATSGGAAGAADANDPLGSPTGAAAAAADDPLADDEATRLESEISAAARAGRRARQEQEADARLAELKRRMGK